MVGLVPGCDPWSVAPSDDLPPRRRLLLPVLIATLLLAVIGTSAGLVLGARAQQRAQPSVTTQAPEPGPAPRSGKPCRPETQKQAVAAGAAGVLRIELHVRTATSAVWICSDDGGRLYYHANRKSAKGTWIEGQTALFLSDVTPDGDGFRAVATDGQGRQTTFQVDSERLLINHKNGSQEEQRAVSQ